MPLFTLTEAVKTAVDSTPPRRRPPTPLAPKELEEEEELLIFDEDEEDDVSVDNNLIPGSLIAVSAAITASSILPDCNSAALRNR